MVNQYKDVSEIKAVVRGFESCTTPKDDFRHCDHLTVAVFYLHESSECEAIVRMRAGLLCFLEYHGVGQTKFHETLTVFWIKALRAYLVQFDSRATLLEKTNRSLERFCDSRRVFDHYSEELLGSDEARSNWIEPDLKVIS